MFMGEFVVLKDLRLKWNEYYSWKDDMFCIIFKLFNFLYEFVLGFFLLYINGLY